MYIDCTYLYVDVGANSTFPVNHFPTSPRMGFPEASVPPTPSRRSYDEK